MFLVLGVKNLSSIPNLANSSLEYSFLPPGRFVYCVAPNCKQISIMRLLGPSMPLSFLGKCLEFVISPLHDSNCLVSISDWVKNESRCLAGVKLE